MSQPTAVPTGNTYDKYGAGNGLERRLVENFLKKLTQALPNGAPENVLEVGVGEGEVAERVASRFRDATIVGLDLPDPELSDHWAQRGLVGAFGDIGRLPFPDQAFDLVLAIEVLEHITDPDAALSEISRVARGDVVISVPMEPLWRMGNMLRGRYLRDFGNTPGHIQHFGPRQIVKLVSEHLEVTAVRRPLPWTMVVARVSA